uniref:DNA ligase IV domain-containing protein n=1 Tax=Romanomermis culicivorax TaxID=13658 RepID=A0A915KUS2_ROMCU
MWFVTKHTQSAFSLNYDEFGDSYTCETNVQDLKNLFDDIDSKGINKGELVETHFEYLSDYKYGLFKRLNAYIDRTATESAEQINHLFRMNLTENLMRLYGATILTSVDIFCSHVVLDSM